MRAFLMILLASAGGPSIAQVVADTTDPARYSPLAVGNIWVYESPYDPAEAPPLGRTYLRRWAVAEVAVGGDEYFVIVAEQASETVPAWDGAGRDTVRFDAARGVLVARRGDVDVDQTCPLGADFGEVVPCAIGGVVTESTASQGAGALKGFVPADGVGPVPYFLPGVGFAGEGEVGGDQPSRDRIALIAYRIVDSDGTQQEDGLAQVPISDVEPDPTDPARYVPLHVGFEREDEIDNGIHPPAIRTRRAIVGDTLVDGRVYAVEIALRAFDMGDGFVWGDPERRLLRFDDATTAVVEWEGQADRPVTPPLGAHLGTLVDVPGRPPDVLPDGRSGHQVITGVDPEALAIAAGLLEVEAVKTYLDVPAITLADYSSFPGNRYGVGVGEMPTMFYPSSCPLCTHEITFLRTVDGDGGVIELGNRFPVADERAPEPSTLALAASPNPAAGPLALALNVPEAGAVTVEAFDALGRRVWRHETALAAGRQRIGVDASRWAPGLYVVRAQAGEAIATATVVRR